MRNNVGHVARERDRLLEQANRNGRSVTADEWRAHAALATHTRRQNIVALVPLGLLVIFTAISGFDRSGLRQFVGTKSSP
jgi:hypothetical protein